MITVGSRRLEGEKSEKKREFLRSLLKKEVEKWVGIWRKSRIKRIYGCCFQDERNINSFMLIGMCH